MICSIPFVFLLSSLVFSIPVQLTNQGEYGELTSSSFADLELYSQFAAASYCPQNTDKPGKKLACASKNCPRVEDLKINTILAISNASYVSDVTGFVAIDETRDLIIISFRGTESKKNIYIDMGWHLMPTDICRDCKASHGFGLAWNDTKQAVYQALEKAMANGSKKKIVATGHSLGGAVAGICAADLRSKGFYTDLYTFGAPRFGNKQLADFMTKTSPDLGSNYRTTHLTDPIPNLPGLWTGHADIFPEYFISTPNSKSVKAAEVAVLKALIEGKGSLYALPKDIESHSWYFNHLSSCYAASNGTWLAGPDPTQQEIHRIWTGWAESIGQWMLDQAKDLLINKPLSWLTGILKKHVA